MKFRRLSSQAAGRDGDAAESFHYIDVAFLLVYHVLYSTVVAREL